MDHLLSGRIIKFDEFFCYLLKINLVKRKSPKSPFKLYNPKLMCSAAAIVFIQIICFVISIGQLVLASELKLELLEISKIVALLSGNVLCFYRGINLIMKREKVSRLLRNLESVFPLSGKDQLDIRLHDNVETIRKVNISFGIMTIIGCLGYLAAPIVLSLYDWLVLGESYPIRYPVNSWYPFDANTLVAYPFVFCFQSILIVISGLFFFNDELIFSTSVGQMCMYYRYMGQLVSRLNAKVELTSCQDLKKIILYQQTLEGLQKYIDDIFSQCTFISFTTMKFTIALFVFLIFQKLGIVAMLPLSVSIFVLTAAAYMRCKMGSDLYEASASLLFSIYCHNWFEGSVEYRKMVVTMMMKANKPVKLRVSTRKYIGIEYFKEIVVQTYQLIAILYGLSSQAAHRN